MATTTKQENTKVVVRYLPATLSGDAFWKLIEEKVADKILYWYYVPGETGYVIFVYLLYHHVCA